jgi:hypothetical protein
MKPKNILNLGMGLLATLVVLLILVGRLNMDLPIDAEITPTPLIVQSGSYVWISQEERLDRADAILVGEITSVSETFWNSNSGEPWEPGIPSSEDQDRPVDLLIHTLRVEVDQVIVDQLGVEKSIELTVIGNSPLDGLEWADHDLQVGDKVVMFIEEGEMAWEGGMKTVLRLVGLPIHSYYKQGDDDLYYHELETEAITLDELIRVIDEKDMSEEVE